MLQKTKRPGLDPDRFAFVGITSPVWTRRGGGGGETCTPKGALTPNQIRNLAPYCSDTPPNLMA